MNPPLSLRGSTRRQIVAAVLLTVGIAFQNAEAGGFRLPDQDAFATGRGEAFVATADNASAIYYNPAGIGQLRGHNVRGGLYSIGLQSSYEGSGQSAETKGEIHPVPQFFYAYGCKELPFSFGLGAYSPYGLSVEWPDNTPFRQAAIKGSLQYMTLNPVVAWRVAPTLSIAAGLTLNRAEVDLQQGLFPPPTTGNQFRFEGNDTAAGFNLGLLWQVSSNISFGAAYRSQTTFNMEGSAELTPPLVPNGPASTSYPFPQNIVGGISWRPTPKWNLEFDLEWTDWNRLNALTVNSTYLPPQSTVLNWESSFYYEFGVTRYFENGWHLSAGYILNENAMPEDYYNPLVADQDRHFFSVGTGLQARHWSFDVAYQFGYGPERNVSGSIPYGGAADGSYSFISHAISLTAGYRF